MADPVFVLWLEKVLDQWLELGAIARANVLSQLYGVSLSAELADKLNQANQLLMLCNSDEEHSY